MTAQPSLKHKNYNNLNPYLVPGVTMLYRPFKLFLLLVGLTVLSACDSGGFSTRSASQLADLVIQGGSLEPAFSSDHQSYRLTLDDSGKPLTLTPRPAHDLATVTMNGQPLANGEKTAPLNITETPYSVTIRVVSPDESRFTEYRIVVLRPGDTVPDDFDDSTPSSGPTTDGGTAALARLELADARLTQTFNPASTDYDASVGYLTTTTRLTAKPASTTATVTVNGASVTAPDYQLSLPLQEGENRIEIAVTSADGKETQTYHLAIMRTSADSFVQQNILKADTPQRGAKFGYSMAVVGEIAAISAPDSSVQGKLSAGSVHIFHLIDDNWVEVQQLTEIAPKTGNRFGYSIAMNSNTLAISAFGYDGRRRDSGRVYLYQPASSGKWALQSSLQSPRPTTRERFGYNISLSGINMAVATLRGPDGTDSAGDVHLYQYSNGGWAFMQTIDIPGASDRFGQSIVMDGDLLAIGSFADDNECRDRIDDAGSVTLYRLNGTKWAKAAELKADNGDGGDRFGFALALSGKTLAVGAICEDGLTPKDEYSGAQAGAVYVFTEDGGQWAQRAYVKEPIIRNHNLFGYRIALTDDLMAVGAPLNEGNGEDSGTAYLYQRSGGDWKAIRTIQPADIAAFDEFGVDLELSAGNLLIGSIQTRKRGAAATGKVYSYR